MRMTIGNGGKLDAFITVSYQSSDGFKERKKFVSLAKAQAYAERRVGKTPELGSRYAVSGDGIGVITCGGCQLRDLFPELAALNAKPREPHTYRLGSSEYVGAPGIVAWAINGFAFEADRPLLTNMISETWSIPPAAAEALLSKRVPYTIENGAVIFRA